MLVMVHEVALLVTFAISVVHVTAGMRSCLSYRALW